MPQTYWLETLGCPKNQVDSEKLEFKLESEGAVLADSAETADIVLVNTCAFIEDARKESLEAIHNLSLSRKPHSRLVVTGCMAERYGDELNQIQIDGTEIDQVAGFGVPVVLKPSVKTTSFDLLNLPRPPAKAPWAYLKIAEGCDRKCGYCVIPSFRGPQKSRTQEAILQELEGLDIQEAVLIAQDLGAYGRDKNSTGSKTFSGDPSQNPVIDLIRAVGERVEWVRLLYLYPSDLTENLISAILDTQVPYFDLSLQHASKNLLRKMRRYGSGEIFSRRISEIREKSPEAVFRSNFIVGYPGETEADHEELLEFIENAQLDWGAFFLYSEEEGSYSEELEGKVDLETMMQRRSELQSLQLDITESHRDELVGRKVRALIQASDPEDVPDGEIHLEARTYREAPEIDGVIHISGPAQSLQSLKPGSFLDLEITGASGCDLNADL